MQSKHTQKPSSRINIPMCAAGVLLCLTLLSIHLTSGLYAKYTATATGSDSARVAKFEVVTSGEQAENVVVFTDGVTTDGVYTFQIQNNSEVAVKYTLSLTYKDGSAPAGVSADFDGATDDGTLAVGASADRTLTFAVNWADFTKDASNTPALEKTFKFTVKVHVEQID